MSQLLQTRPIDAGFMQCTCDMCLYFMREGGEMTVTDVYVDELLVTATTAVAFDSIYGNGISFDQKPGQVSKFLGFRVKVIDSSVYALYPEEPIDDLLLEHGFASANPTLTPGSDDCYNEFTSGSLSPDLYCTNKPLTP